MDKKYIAVPGRLESVATDGQIAGASQVYDDDMQKSQAKINADVEANAVAAAGVVNDINNRLEIVEQLADISVAGGEIGIATPSDFDNPTAEQRAKVPTVGAIIDGADIGGSYDVSVKNSGATYANLSTALAAIPTAKRKPGMTVRFINSETSKYEEWRYMNTTLTEFTTVSNWQGIDDEPTAESENLVKSGGVYGSIRDIQSLVIENEKTEAAAFNDLNNKISDINEGIGGINEALEDKASVEKVNEKQDKSTALNDNDGLVIAAALTELSENKQDKETALTDDDGHVIAAALTSLNEKASGFSYILIETSDDYLFE